MPNNFPDATHSVSHSSGSAEVPDVGWDSHTKDSSARTGSLSFRWKLISKVLPTLHSAGRQNRRLMPQPKSKGWFNCVMLSFVPQSKICLSSEGILSYILRFCIETLCNLSSQVHLQWLSHLAITYSIYKQYLRLHKYIYWVGILEHRRYKGWHSVYK